MSISHKINFKKNFNYILPISLYVDFRALYNCTMRIHDKFYFVNYYGFNYCSKSFLYSKSESMSGRPDEKRQSNQNL